MKKNIRSIIITTLIILLPVTGVLYFAYSFFSAFAPPKITLTKDYISTNGYFDNGVSIEKIQVDSIGNQGYPIKYTVLYTTSCNIHYSMNKAPKKIDFNKPGEFSWDEDTNKVRYIHDGLSRQALDSSKKLWWLNKFGKHPVCPISFEQEKWYFISIGNPQVTGIFFFIDKLKKEHQYYLESGVSPI